MRRVMSAALFTLAACSLFSDPGGAIERRQRSGTAGPGAAGTGMIVSVEGDVRVRGRWPDAEAWEGLAVTGADSVVVPAGASVSGFKPSGEPFVSEGPTVVSFAETAPQFRNRIHDRTARLIASWPGLDAVDPFGTPARHDWEGASVEPAPLIPVDGGSVRPVRSRFWWKTLEGIDKYEIEIRWQEGKKTRRMRQTVRDANMLTVEGLEPGREYTWIVRTREGKRIESRPRSFRVLTPDEKAVLEDITYGLPDVMAGALMLAAGLHEEAIQYFDVALAAGPQARSALVWRSRAFAAVGRFEEAYRDLADATVRNTSRPDAYGDDDGSFDAFRWETEEVLKETRPRSGGTLPH